MNYGFMIVLSMNIFESPLNFYMHDLIFLYFSSTIDLVWPTRSGFLMGEMLSFGFNLAVSSPRDKVGVARHILYCCHQE